MAESKESQVTLNDFLTPEEKAQMGSRFAHYLVAPLKRTGHNDLLEISDEFKKHSAKWHEDHKHGVQSAALMDKDPFWEARFQQYQAFFYARHRATKAGWVVPSHIVDGDPYQPPSILRGTLHAPLCGRM